MTLLVSSYCRSHHIVGLNMPSVLSLCRSCHIIGLIKLLVLSRCQSHHVGLITLLVSSHRQIHLIVGPITLSISSRCWSHHIVCLITMSVTSHFRSCHFVGLVMSLVSSCGSCHISLIMSWLSSRGLCSSPLSVVYPNMSYFVPCLILSILPYEWKPHSKYGFSWGALLFILWFSLLSLIPIMMNSVSWLPLLWLKQMAPPKQRFGHGL